jgi:hypothetical protein
MLIKTATDTLIEAGRTLAQLGDPDKDLLNFSNDFREIASTLRFLGEGLEKAYEAAEDRRDAIRRAGLSIDHTNRAYQNDSGFALGTAKKTAQRALVDLARLVGEVEAQMLLTERLRFARGEG